MTKSSEKLERYKEQLRNFFLKLSPETPLNELDELVDEFNPEIFQKKHMIISPGDNSEMVYFICEGIIRIFTIKEDKEVTNWFIKENMVFAPTYSLLTGKGNENFYEALERTEVMKIKYSVMESYYKKYHSIEHLGRKMIEAYYALFMKRSNEVCFLSADERYHIFVEEHSELLNRVSLRNIASYLGVSQETLSRLRAKH